MPDDNVIGHHAEQGNSRAYSIARVQRECDAETVAADLIGQVYNQRKQTKGGDRKSFPQNEGLIGEMADVVADELGVGRATAH